MGWIADIEALPGPVEKRLDNSRHHRRVNAALQSILSYAAGGIRVSRAGRWCEIAAFAEAEGERAAVDETATFCRNNGIDAHVRTEGWLWSATSKAAYS